MKITQIELFHVSMPVKNTFYPAWIPGYPQDKNRFTLARLMTDDGFVGVAAGMAFSEEREGLGKLLAPYLLGLDPCDTGLMHQRLFEGSILHWRNYFLELAAYDIKAQVEDKPLWKLLGGTDKPIPVYWSTGSVCEPKKHAKIIERAEKEGYKTVKLRVHAKTLEEDVKVIKETRAITGRDYPVAIDVNQGWPVTIVDRIPMWDLLRARTFVNAIKDENIAWLEEPLYMRAYEDLAELRKDSPIKIAGAELNYGWDEVRMMLHFGSFDIYQPDVTFFGIIDTLKTIEATREHGLAYSPHTWTNGIGLWSNMHMYALADREHPLEFPHEPGTWTLEARDGMLTSPIIPKDGYLELSQEPGLAAPIDWDKIKKFSTCFFSMTEGDLRKQVMKEKGIVTALKLKRRKDKEAKSG